MDNVSLSHFDLKLLSQDGHINKEGVQHYRCCLNQFGGGDEITIPLHQTTERKK
jgi:hypothetical protein